MPANEPPRRTRSFLLIMLFGLAIGTAVAAMTVGKAQQPIRPLTTSDLRQQILDGNVKTATINQSSRIVTGELDNNDRYRASYPSDDWLIALFELAEGGSTITASSGDSTTGDEKRGAGEASNKDDTTAVRYTFVSSKSSSGNWLILFGVLVLIGVLILFSRTRSSAARAANGAPGRMIEAGEVPVTFNDVAGCDEVVTELAEIKGFLSEPDRFRKLGANIPKGVLLFGPPGTGKTLLARAVAGEAGVPFFYISGSDFVEMYVGVGASRVRKLFEQAKQQSPCVVFIDEIDAVGRRRSGSAQGGQEERENTLNQLLVEIDGFSPNDNVIVMAASNRADILDPALTRPGRFDRQVIVDTPDRKGRREILRVHSKGKPFATTVDLDAVAAQTAGFCGADLANLVNEAALLAARDGREEIIPHDMEEATMRVLAGPQKTRIVTDKEKRTIATHEIGHAIMAHVLEDSEPVHKVTIVGRGRALGLMVSLQEEDRLLHTRSALMAQLAVALGGRVAEEITFDEITTGAANDLEKVNEIAQAMVLKMGMSDDFALRSFVMDDHLVVHSNDLKDRIDAAIDAIVHEARLTALTTLTEHREQLDRLSNILIDRETIDRAQFEALMRGENPFEDLEEEVEDPVVVAAARQRLELVGAGVESAALQAAAQPGTHFAGSDASEAARSAWSAGAHAASRTVAVTDASADDGSGSAAEGAAAA